MLECRDEGAGPAVLLLHGCPGSLDTFAGIIEHLRPRYRVIAPALPGYHGSPALRPHDLDRSDEALEDLLRTRGVDRLAAVVGFSFGTYRALRFAIRWPERVRTVCALGGFAGLTGEERDGLRSFLPLLRGHSSDDPMLRAIVVERNLSAHHRARRPEDAQRVDSWMGATTPEVIADEIEAFAGGPDLSPRLAEANLRLFIRVGALDVATPPEQARRMAAAARGAELEEIPGVAHAQMIEDPTGTAQWLSRCLAAAERS